MVVRGSSVRSTTKSSIFECGALAVAIGATAFDYEEARTGHPISLDVPAVATEVGTFGVVLPKAEDSQIANRRVEAV